MNKSLEDKAFEAWVELAKEAGVDAPDITAMERALWRLRGAQQVCNAVFGSATQDSVMATFKAINEEAARVGTMLDAL